MPILSDARAANLGASVSEIFSQHRKLEQNQALMVANIIAGDPNFNRAPDYWINIFNISSKEQIRHRPVDFPTIRIAACPKGQPWILAVRIPSIINFKMVSPDTGQPSFSSLRGERFATDLINPANLGEQMWVEVSNPDMDNMHGGGDDLSRRGIFWSVRQPSIGCPTCQGRSSVCLEHDVPSADDLQRAKTRMERHYREMVQKAEDLARTGKMGEIGEEHHTAANYLHVNSGWHIQTAVQESCPNCGDPINPGVAYHASSIGGVCILDWKRTVASGVKTKADVPDEFRWWAESDADEPEKRGPGRFRKLE